MSIKIEKTNEMNKRRYYRIAIGKALAISLVLSAFSCTKDPLREGPRQPEPGVPVQVELNFRVPKFDDPQATESKTAAPVAAEPLSEGAFHVSLDAGPQQSEADGEEPPTRAAEAPLYNLWVLQFSADGTARTVVRVSTDEKPVYENQTIEVELLTGSDQTIYMLALGKQYGAVDLSGIGSLDELEATSFDFVRYRNGLPVPVVRNAEDVPYSGSCGKLSIIRLEENGKGYVDYRNSEGFSGAISLKALVSLVTIDFSYQVDQMTPFSIALNNVPTTFAVNSAAYKPSQFVNLPATLLEPTGLAGGKRLTMSWYTAPNPQGVVSTITSETDRYFYYKTGSTTPTGTAPRDGTYIHFWASKDDAPGDYALYYLFLGSNTVNDFNIRPHSHYRYRTDINTADDLNDKRIIYKTLVQSVDFSATVFQSPKPNLYRDGTGFDLDAHPDMRPIEITALRGEVSVEILPGSDNGAASSWPAAGVAPIDPAGSWLKLSTYPNYTAALEAFRAGDPNALATSVRLDASIPGLFRLYLYSDEYEKYVTDNTNNSEHKRSLFVRFTFRTETDKSDVYTARMDQLPAFYLGEFGGEPEMVGGEFRYPKGLVLEAKKEYESYRYLDYMPNRLYLYGAYGSTYSAPTPSDNDVRKYHGYDIYNGRTATILMAENRYRLSPIAAGDSYLDRIVAPRYVNGHVDLYQYKYYTGDGFAQRWCYDKNRDKNGNGYLDDDEIVWYVPSIAQVLSIPLNCYTTSTDYFRDRGYTGIYDFNLYSISMYSRSGRIGVYIYSGDAVSTSIGSSVTYRCVRDVEPRAGGPGGVRYYERDGYAVIDATGLWEGASENRVNNPDVVILPGAGDDPSYTGRVIRHYSGSSAFDPEGVHSIDRKVSRRFRVAPCDVDIQGKPVPAGTYKNMTWAEAAGYVTEANTLPVTAEKTGIAETGCAAYKGIDGADDPALGKWRLPTLREALLIGMMDQAMEADNARTGYIPLFYLDTSNFIAGYWTATEYPDGTGQYDKNRAYYLYAAGRMKTVGGENNRHAWQIGKDNKAVQSYYQRMARCIQDLP